MYKKSYPYYLPMQISFLIFFIVIIDTGSKWLTNIFVPNYSMLDGLLHITRVKNTGIAFGYPLPLIHFIIPLILLAGVIYITKNWKHLSHYEKIGYSIILTGGILNAVERTLFGSVTDMFSIKYFAVCNIADIAISIAVWILLFTSFFPSKKTI